MLPTKPPWQSSSGGLITGKYSKPSRSRRVSFGRFSVSGLIAADMSRIHGRFCAIWTWRDAGPVKYSSLRRT